MMHQVLADTDLANADARFWKFALNAEMHPRRNSRGSAEDFLRDCWPIGLPHIVKIFMRLGSECDEHVQRLH
jgi:hypothetical protein